MVLLVHGQLQEQINFKHFTMKNLTFVLIVFFITIQCYSQHEYKLSAEGFTFGKPVGSTVKLTIYLSASNIGSIEEFGGQLRNIKLISKKYNSVNYQLEEYKRIIDNDKSANGYTIVSLSYIVPVDANDISLVLPEIYGSLNIPVTLENYEQWIAKGNNTGDSPKNRQSVQKNIYGKALDYIGYTLSGGYGLVKKNNEVQGITIDANLQLKLFKFGKSKKSTVFLQGGYMWRFILGGKSEYSKFFNLNNTNLITEYDYGVDTTRFNAGLVYGGIGYSYRINEISIITAVNYGNLFQNLTATRVKDTIENVEYKNLDFKMDVWKLDIGFLYKYLFIGYSFIYGDMKKNNPIIDGVYRIHNFKIGIGGF